MESSDHQDPPAATLDDMIEGIEAKAFQHCGRPAMALVLRQRNPSRPWVTFPYPFVLVENPDGTPLAGTVPGYRWEQDKMEMPGVNAEGSIPLVMSWFTGEFAWSTLINAHEYPAIKSILTKGTARACARISELVEATLPTAGFSETFVESLRCMRAWAVNPGYALNRLFANDAVGREAREFTRRYPLISSLQLPVVIHKAQSGPVGVTDIFPGLGLRSAAALEAPDWFRTGQTYEQVFLYGSNPDEFIGFVAATPPEWIKADGVMQARNFLRTYLLSRCLLRMGADAATLAKPSRGDWTSFQRRCREASGKTRLLDKYENPYRESFLIDPVADFAKKVVIPVMAGSGELPPEDSRPDPRLTAETVAFRILYREKSLPGCYEAARKWHDHLPGIMAAMPDDADTSSWQPLFDEVIIDGITLRPLVTGREIEDEGTRGKDPAGMTGLDHCVASYRPQACRGASHIVSLRRVRPDGSFVRLATAEIVQDAKGRLRLVQLQGKANADPPSKATAAMEAFLKANQRLPFIARRASDHENHVRELCGYDWLKAANIRRACLAYAMMLPRGLRADPDALAAAIKREWDAEHASSLKLAA